MKEREMLFLLPPKLHKREKASEQVTHAGQGESNLSHQRLRFFGIMKTFSSEFESLKHLQITDMIWDIMIHYCGKSDQLDPTQTSFKTPVCSDTCFPTSLVSLVQSVSSSPTQWHFAEMTSNVTRCSCKPCCLLHRRVSEKETDNLLSKFQCSA